MTKCWLLFLVSAAACSVQAAQTPIAVSGFNHDLVVEKNTAVNSAALKATISATMDGGTAKTGSTWYEVGENTAATTTGLPMGTTLASASDPNTIFTLQPAIGSNAILIDSSNTAGTFTFATP